MAAGTRVIGEAAILAAFAEASRLVSENAMEDSVRKIAERVAESSKQKISLYTGASLSTIVPRVLRPTHGRVYQNKRKVTGNHPSFGRLQIDDMRESLDENEEAAVREFGTMISKVVRVTGF